MENRRMGATEYWYALHTKPYKERLTADYLHQQRLEVYLPLVQVNPVNPRAARERPYFPGYLFTKVNARAIEFSALRWVPGIRGLVQFGGEPAIVPDSLLSELRRRLMRIRAAGGQVFYGLAPGDQVKIVDGPFAEYEAIFDLRLNGTDRVRVLLQLLNGRSIPVELSAAQIQRIKRR